MQPTTVYADIETGGLNPDSPIIQIAAVAIRDEIEISSFECKIVFREEDCVKEALELVGYTQDKWREAVSRSIAIARFSAWLKPYQCVKNISKRTGNPFYVAQLAGYNIVAFDLPRLRNFYGDTFFPVSLKPLDVYQLVMWYLHLYPEEQPKDTKLATICEHFGVPLDGAHDALNDVRATAKLATELKRRLLGAVAA